MSNVQHQEQSSLQIGKKAFLSAIIILLVLMIFAGVLTRMVPSGEYERKLIDGREMVVPGSYTPVEVSPPAVWRWFTAPFEVLWGTYSLTINTIILLLVLISGAFHILETGGIMKSILRALVERFTHKKYLLMAIIIFFFMFSAAVLGIYEGMVPMVVIVVPLAYALGWDSLTGLGMSLLAMAFGFSAAVTNPFTIGVAQGIAGLPLFSGAWLRVLFFIIVYVLVFLFVRHHAMKVEQHPQASPVYKEDLGVRQNYSIDAKEGETYLEGGQLRRSLWWVLGWIGAAIVFVLVSSQIESIAFLAF